MVLTTLTTAQWLAIFGPAIAVSLATGIAALAFLIGRNGHLKGY